MGRTRSSLNPLSLEAGDAILREHQDFQVEGLCKVSNAAWILFSSG